jgi:hypothetical protein
MAMHPECPRCPTLVVERDGVWLCPLHGETAPLWRTTGADYDSLVEHLELAGATPSWVLWPVPPGWAVTDFGSVPADTAGDAAVATFVTCSGATAADGPVTLTAVTEEPGVGLGARVAGVVHDDPGPQTQDLPVQLRARVGGTSVPLWLLSTTTEGVAGSEQEQPWDRAVLVGESEGRWLWLVTTPASAALGLGDWGVLDELRAHGPALVELRFGTRSSGW